MQPHGILESRFNTQHVIWKRDSQYQYKVANIFKTIEDYVSAVFCVFPDLVKLVAVTNDPYLTNPNTVLICTPLDYKIDYGVFQKLCDHIPSTITLSHKAINLGPNDEIPYRIPAIIHG